MRDFHGVKIAHAKHTSKNFSKPHPFNLQLRMQWHSISLSGHTFTACKSKSLSKYCSIHVFIMTSCSSVDEKLAIRGIVWLSNDNLKGREASRRASRQHGSPCLHARYTWIHMYLSKLLSKTTMDCCTSIRMKVIQLDHFLKVIQLENCLVCSIRVSIRSFG